MLIVTHPIMIILERSEVKVFPSPLTTTNGDIALFDCNAEGSNISVIWIFNESACGPDHCEQNGTSIYRNQTLNGNIFVINTTLEIRTGELHSVIVEKTNYTIQCIVKQNLDYSSLEANDVNITIIFTVDPISGQYSYYIFPLQG